MKKSRTTYAKMNIIAGILNKLIVLGLPFILRTIILYNLGEKYLGLDSLFTSILQMLNLAELGFSTAVVFCMYKPIAEDDTDSICALLNLYRKVYRIIGFFVLLVGLSLMPFLKYLIKDKVPNNLDIRILFLFFLVNTILGYLLYAYKSSILIASQRNDIVNYINSAVIIVQSIIQATVIFVFHNYYLYLAMMPIFTIFNNLLIAYVTKRKYPHYICRGKLSSDIAKELKYKISGLMISKLCVTSRNSLDSIIVSAFVTNGLTQVAIYGNYYYIMGAVHSILSIITKSISATVGNSIVLESKEKNYKDMMKFVFLYSWIAGICTNCLLNLYQPFMKIWVKNDALIFPTEIVILFVIYFFALTLGDVRTIYMTGAGLWWEGRYRSIAEVICNLVLNIVWGKLYGVKGVVWATIFSIVIINFGYGSHILFKYYFKNKKTKNYFALQLYTCFVVTLSCLISWNVCKFVTIGGFGGLLLRALISLIISNIVYLILYCRLPVFSEAMQFSKRLIKK